MHLVIQPGEPVFRLWIVAYDHWRPNRWNDTPPHALALEVVDDGVYSASEAASFLEGFNERMIESDEPLWAVAIPVSVHFHGDARPGVRVCGHVFSVSDS
jgi:hypothetical protein